MRGTEYKTSKEFAFVVIGSMVVYTVTNPVFMNTFQVFTFGLFMIAARFKVEQSSENNCKDN